MTTLELAAERITGEWALVHRGLVGEREQSLVLYTLRVLADPASDHGAVLEDITRWRRRAGVVTS
ncbi:MAG: hypothetical protein JO272_01145 [Pseudonocardiales bacterium]|nr:hypothetical protein [Pseudonocardiales bacterium]